jgi:PiT family inorganic phosphate transporter
MEIHFYTLLAIIGVALIFDFINGFHDAANSIATIVSTRVLKPHWAVMWAAFFNFIAFLIFDTHVAHTIGTGIIDPEIIDPFVVLAALLGAIFWNLFTWYFGIPSSSSHALVGGLVGAALAKVGWQSLVFSGIAKTGIAIFASPILGLLLAYIFMRTVIVVFFRQPQQRVNRAFRVLQFFSAALYSIGHGGNDAQKTMGIILALLIAAKQVAPDASVPLEVVLLCHFAMGLGTLFGGWRIVKTMGMKITKLRPVGGFCAETAGASTLFIATGLGIPVSTTHTITGAIMGVGAVTKFSAVRWGVAARIVWAWFLTIPASAAVSGIAFWLISKMT